MDNNDEDIYNWVDEYQLTRQKKNINRDFSDAVPLAEILKCHYPKLVELHNYTARNSVSEKASNWDTLNRKVLRKLCINLNHATIEQLSRATPGAIEKVLGKVKKTIESKKAAEIQSNLLLEVEGLSAEMGEGGILPVKMKRDGKISEQKIVPADIYDKLYKDVQDKDETISVLKHKVQHLENLLQIKEERITDLIEQQKRTNEHDSYSQLTKKFTETFFGKKEAE